MFQRQLVEDDSKPYAFRVCFADEQIKSVQVQLENSQTKDWLNTIGDYEYYKTNFDTCTVYRPTKDGELVMIFISIGYVGNQGVVYIQMTFAPDYKNSRPNQEVNLTVGKQRLDMDFVNLAFSHKNAFIGFTGVTSDFGLPINKLGVVYFLCAPDAPIEQPDIIETDIFELDPNGNTDEQIT